MGNLKWTSDVPLLNNSYILMDVLFVLLASAGGLGLILFLIMGAAEIFTVLRIITLTLGILIVLAFGAMGVVMLNNVQMTFTLNEDGIQTDMGKRENKMNKIALFFGILAGKPGLMGSSMLAMSREQTFVEWKDIQKAVFDGKKHVISLSSGRRMLVRLFCTPEAYADAMGYVLNMLPDAETKHI